MRSLLFCPLGLLLFLGGLKLLSGSLAKMAGTSLAFGLHRFTGTRFSAFLLGLAVTTVTQSSSLTTVAVVSFTDAGLLPLRAAIAVIIGANVGTTVTGQLVSLRIQSFALPIGAAGIITMALARPGKLRETGRAVTGLGVLLAGLNLMVGALHPLCEAPWFLGLIRAAAGNPLLGVMAGAAATALVQSSSTVAGIVLALAKAGALNLAAGISLIIGADVGTCITSLLAGAGAGRAARAAALSHLLFNIISVLLVLPYFKQFTAVAADTSDSLPRQLANAHTLYNLGGAVLLLSMLSPYEKLINALTASDNTKKKRICALIGELFAKWF